MRIEIDPKVDYAFKRLFGDEAHSALLIHLLNAVLQPPPGRRVREIHLLNPFNEKEYLTDKLSVVDLKVRDQGGRQFLVEMQLLVPWVFPKRVLYYWARLHQQQMQEGDAYETLVPTITLCFINEALRHDDTRYHLRYRLWDDDHRHMLTRDLEMHILDLSKFDVPAERVATPLEQWCYFLKHATTLDPDDWPPALEQPELRQAVEVLKMLTNDEQERHRYEDRLKAQRDQASLLYAVNNAKEVALLARQEGLEEGHETGMKKGLQEGLEKGLEKGMEKGLEKGREEGLEKGREIGRIHLCEQLLRQPLTPREDLLRLTPDELRTRADELQQRVLPNSN